MNKNVKSALVCTILFGMSTASINAAEYYQTQNPSYYSNEPYSNQGGYYSNEPNSNQRGGYYSNEPYSNQYSNEQYTYPNNYSTGTYQERNSTNYSNERLQNQNSGYNYGNYANDRYQDQGYMNNRNQNTYSSDDTYSNRNEYVSDQDLLKKISDKIGSGWFSKGYENVNAQVNNGNVTLTGTVKTMDDKEKVEKEVRNIRGVRSLNSQISAQEPGNYKNSRDYKDYQDSRGQFSRDTGSSSTDNQLNKKIRDDVSRGWLWNSYKEVVLVTTNGVVVLEGFVGTPSDEQKLIKEVGKVEGVKQVRSNLKFRNSSSSNPSNTYTY